MSKFKRWISIIMTITLLCTTLLSTRMIVKASLLPLEEVKAYLVLNGYTNEELKKMSVDSILSMLKDSDGNSIEIADDATTVWHYVKDDKDALEVYKPYIIGLDTEENKIDLSQPEGITTFQFEIIVGKDGALNSSNKRYIIKAYLSENFEDDLDVEIFLQDDNNVRTQAVPDDCKEWVCKYSDGITEEIVFDLSFGESITGSLAEHGTVWLNIKSKLADDPRVKVVIYPVLVYGSSYVTVKTPIEKQILNQNMVTPGKGYQISGKKNTDETFQIVTYVDGKEYSKKYIGVRYWNWYPCHDGTLFSEENGNKIDVFDDVVTGFDFEKNVSQITFELKPDLNASNKYYFDYNFVMQKNFAGSASKTNYDSLVKKVVVGHYDSIEEADEAGAQDVTSDILNRGYLADYSGDGIDFTVFKYDRLSTSFPIVYDTLVDKINIKAVENPNLWREFTDAPIVGEADPWLRVTGATDSRGKKYNVGENNVYIVENGKSINMDTYYGYGYQTLFINDEDVDLSSLKPCIEYANNDRVYAVLPGSSDPIDKNHVRDFTSPNQQYTGVIDGNDRNYWITFKKLNNMGPELYVYGPSEREVILDEYFEFKHDILIANIGNAPLEDVSVELIDAENVKLDPYWTVGGNGNNTLAPFTTTSVNSEYGELPNLTKIRLLPDGNGEVKGTLKITASGQEILIKLKGTAQNPDIINEKLSDAVKYVPYQQIVATNNIHDWIKTQFSIVDGTLPAGITLNSETGEIYGVPRVPDGDTETTYTFTVEANYFDDGRDGYFEPSRKEFTLTVKPNTDENVYNESDTDKGYYIKQHIGTENGENHYVLDLIEDTEFTSNGEFDEFFKLWLNGNELIWKKDPELSDYYKEPGSTKITIKSQTMENNTNPDGANTIAMEFRKDTDGDGKGDNGAEMNRTSQNYYIKQETNVDKVIEKIQALPKVSNITLSNKSAVQAARSAYDALSTNDQAKVTNRQKLFDLETKITALEEANKVIEKINNIPAHITSEAKDEIQAARVAYDVLTDEQKKLVTNFDRLVKAEQILSKYETDSAAAQKVDNLIKNLPSPLKLADEDKVNNARTAYSNLTADQKRYVTKEEVLRAAENEIVRLKAEAQEQAKINAVISAIDAIPENLTLSDKSIVEAARTAYNTLTDSQKKKVVNIDELTKAENTIDALETQENASKADRAAAQEVIDLIDDLPKEANLADKSTIEAARVAYEKLTNKQKKLVTNYSDLTEAEATIKALEDYEVANKKDQAAADEVINLISAIPSDITLDDKATVENARNAYNALTDNQKKIVINYKTLIDAEVIIAKIENDNYKEIKSITFVGILVDEDGKALVDRIVEIHSVVQTGRTDENGSFQFNSVEFGKHTIFVKDDNGNIIAQREFNITQGSPLSLKGNDVIAENGSIFTIKMQLDNDKLTFLNIEEGNKAPVINTDMNNESTYIEEDNVTIPNTGDDSNIALWIILLLASITGLAITAHSGYKQRKYANGHSRV